MNTVRKFRKGDKLESNKGFIHEVVGNETDGGTVRTKLIEQPEVTESRYRYSTSEEKRIGNALRRSWTLIEEGPAKRPNNRVTKIKAVDIRLGETIRSGDDVFVPTRKVGVRGRWTILGTDKTTRVLDGSDDVEVLGTRGRALPKTVHYNPFAAEGSVTVQRNTLNPGLGHHACGVVSNIDVYARDIDLVTCEQACKEEARDGHWRREAQKAKGEA